jgi:hypothetical protein
LVKDLVIGLGYRPCLEINEKRIRKTAKIAPENTL